MADDNLEVRRLDDPAVILFSRAELADRASGHGRLAPGFGEKLAMLRMVFGRPMRVNSCCRDAARNRAIGGHPRSLHVWDANAHGLDGAAAVDIATPDGAYALGLTLTALDLGWSVGVAKGFIHLDRRDLAGLNPAVFGYG